MKWISNLFTQLGVTFRTALKTLIAGKYIRYIASLSYCTIFSLAPLLFVTFSACGYFLGRQAHKFGLYFAAMAGYNPQEAIASWERLAAAGGAKPPEF